MAIMLLQACGPITIKDAHVGAWVPIQAAFLELSRDVIIPGGHARAFFQNGKQIPRINEFQPFCQLEINTLREHAQTVHADKFTVIHVGRDMKEVVQARPLLLAALHDFRMIGHDDGNGGPTRVTQMIRFDLNSNRQPDVRNLACGGAFDTLADAYAPTVQEIAAALGDYATLVLQ